MKSNDTQDLSSGGRFALRKEVLVLRNKIVKFIEEHVYPFEDEFAKLAHSEARWTVHPAEEKLKELAKKEGLWNLWIPVCLLVLLLVFDIFYRYFVVSEAFNIFPSVFDILTLL